MACYPRFLTWRNIRRNTRGFMADLASGCSDLLYRFMGFGQTTDLGVGSSNLSGRASPSVGFQGVSARGDSPLRQPLQTVPRYSHKGGKPAFTASTRGTGARDGPPIGSPRFARRKGRRRCRSVGGHPTVPRRRRPAHRAPSPAGRLAALPPRSAPVPASASPPASPRRPSGGTGRLCAAHGGGSSSSATRCTSTGRSAPHNLAVLSSAPWSAFTQTGKCHVIATSLASGRGGRTTPRFQSS